MQEQICEWKQYPKNMNNKFSIYALKQAESDSYLKRAGAEVIYGTTAEIFKKVIGKAEEVYAR